MNRGLRKLAASAVGAVLLLGCGVPPPVVTPTLAQVTFETRVEEFIVAEPGPMDKVRAVLVVVDGRTRLEHYRHGFAAGDHEHLWSITKSVVATLVGIAIGEGLVPGLDAPLRELLPEYRREFTASTARTTLRQLMTMTAGFVEFLPSDVEAKLIDGDVDPVAWALSEGQQAEPGSEFQYSNVGAHLVAAVLHSALQRNPATKGWSVLDYARVKLFDPLGIATAPAVEAAFVPEIDVEFDGPGFAWARAGDVEFGAYGLRLTAGDLARFGQLHLDDGMWAGRRVLPEGWVAEATTPSEGNPDYGLMWWLERDGRFDARGFEGQRIVVSPEHHAVLVTLCETEEGQYPLDEIQELVEWMLIPALQE